MSRGSLDKETLQKIAQELPELIGPVLSPDFESIGFSTDSTIPIAGVPLNDAIGAINGARYALHEVLTHSEWYLERKTPPDLICAAFFGRYYCDDMALRLYSAGRWKKSQGAEFVTFGGGDRPAHTVKGLLGFLKPALFLMSDVLKSTKDEYLSIIKENSNDYL